MDLENDDLRRRYRLGRTAFGLLAVGVGLLFLNAATFLAYLVTFNQELGNLIQGPVWEWAVGSPITWATVLGTFLLVGCWDDPSWRRRAAILVVMHLVDLVTWAFQHAEAFGFEEVDFGHAWLLDQAVRGIGWAEFLLFIGLANDQVERLGQSSERPMGQGARLVAAVGLIYWAIVFIDQTNWKHAWPLVQRPIQPPKMYMTLLSSTLLVAIGSFQVTVICLAACRHTGQALGELAHDPDPDGLLRSRSEDFGDAPKPWWDKADDDPWR